MNVHFRKAVKEDFCRINELFMEMLRTIYEKDDVEGLNESDMAYYFAGGENWICVAEIDGKVEGFLSIEAHREEENFLYYDDFNISRAYRSKGIGSAMMEKAEEYCRSLGFSMIVLHVEETNTNARRFYSNRGFTLLRNDGTRMCLVKYLK